MGTYNVTKIATAEMAGLSPREISERGQIRSFFKDKESAIAQADKMMAISESPDYTYFVWLSIANQYAGIIWMRTGGSPPSIVPAPKPESISAEQLNLF